jgi:ubiquinone biosynthesis protein COQ4
VDNNLRDPSQFRQAFETGRRKAMAETRYAYSGEPLRNPLRYLLALWRSVRDPSDTDEVAIVELGLLKTRFARRFVRPGAMLEVLARDPRTAPRLRALRPSAPIDLPALARLPEGTLGRVFAEHCRRRHLNPNLVDLPTGTPEEMLLHHIYATHDIWHVATGWGNDLAGETGLGGFYAAQLGAPAFFALLMTLLILNSVFFEPATLPERLDAFAAGYESGRSAEPLFGVDWAALFALPLAEVRAKLGLVDRRIVGDGIRPAA